MDDFGVPSFQETSMLISFFVELHGTNQYQTFMDTMGHNEKLYGDDWQIWYGIISIKNGDWTRNMGREWGPPGRVTIYQWDFAPKIEAKGILSLSIKNGHFIGKSAGFYIELPVSRHGGCFRCLGTRGWSMKPPCTMCLTSSSHGDL